MAERNSLVALAGFIMLAFACGGESMNGSRIALTEVAAVQEADWKALINRKVYFGHQSVGRNIVQGLEEVLAVNPEIGMTILDLDESDTMGDACFAHSSNGTNKQPVSKIEAFRDRMDSGFGDEVDIAFFKFCFVDILADTDVSALFETYREEMAGLERRHPGTTFLHVTAPLTTVQTGPKAWIKNILGRPVRGVQDNVSRSRFNELMAQEYGESGALFDLAGLESTLPDGTAVTFKSDGMAYPALAEPYTYDGRHLNEQGRRRIGEQLLIFLSGAGD